MIHPIIAPLIAPVIVISALKWVPNLIDKKVNSTLPMIPPTRQASKNSFTVTQLRIIKDAAITIINTGTAIILKNKGSIVWMIICNLQD